MRERAPERIAICAFNDLTAFAMLQAAHSAKMDAPSDFMIIGVDDLPVTPYVSPGLSSVRFEIVDQIDAVATTVIDTLTGAPSSSTESRPFSRIVARETA